MNFKEMLREFVGLGQQLDKLGEAEHVNMSQPAAMVAAIMLLTAKLGDIDSSLRAIHEQLGGIQQELQHKRLEL